jgi:hypothetical protein
LDDYRALYHTDAAARRSRCTSGWGGVEALRPGFAHDERTL